MMKKTIFRGRINNKTAAKSDASVGRRAAAAISL